jgi:hypothetical protein
METYRGVEIKLQRIIHLGNKKDSYLASCSGHFAPRQIPQYRRMRGSFDHRTDLDVVKNRTKSAPLSKNIIVTLQLAATNFTV